MLQIQVWEVFIIGESSSTLHIRTDMHAMLEDVMYNIFGEKSERSSITADFRDLWQPGCLTVGLGSADIPILGKDKLSKYPDIAKDS